MKKNGNLIKIEKKQLENACGILSSNIPKRPTHPILGYYLVTIKEQEIEFIATDLNSWTKCKVDINKDDPFHSQETPILTFCIFATVFNKAIKAIFNSDFVYLNYDHKNSLLEITGLNQNFKFQTLNSEEFPEYNVENFTNSLEVKRETLSLAINKVAHAVAKDNSQPVIGCLYLHFKDKLSAYATDGHRLSIYEYEGVETIENEITILLKENYLSILTKLIEIDNQETISIKSTNDKSAIQFSTDYVSTIFRNVTESYPKVKNLFSPPFLENYEYCFSFSASSLIRNLNCLSNFCENMIMDFIFDPTQKTPEGNRAIAILKNTDKSPHSGKFELNTNIIKANEEQIPPFRLRIDFLTEAAKTFESKQEVCFFYNEPEKPILLTPLTPLEQTTIIHLVMPIRIRRS